jgi:hypothetical protein
MSSKTAAKTTKNIKKSVAAPAPSVPDAPAAPAAGTSGAQSWDENPAEAAPADGEAPAISEAAAATGTTTGTFGTPLKFADQIRAMIPDYDNLRSMLDDKRRQNREKFNRIRTEYRRKIDVFKAKLNESIDAAKLQLQDPNKRRISTFVNLEEMIEGIPLHVYLYGGWFSKPKKDTRRSFYDRDPKFWQKLQLTTSPFNQIQKEVFDKDNLFLLNISDPTRGKKTVIIISAHPSPPEMNKKLWHNQNKLPEEPTEQPAADADADEDENEDEADAPAGAAAAAAAASSDA